MFKIIASDMDGTLLTPEHRFGAYTKKILQSLHQQGYVFAFATGRHHVEVAQYHKQLNIPAYMITSNGARVHDLAGKELFSKNLDPDVIQDIVAMAKTDDSIAIQMYSDTQWLLSKEMPDSIAYHKDTDFTYHLFDVNQPPTQNIAKVYFTSASRDHAHLCEWENKFNTLFKGKVHIAFSTPWCLEVMAMHVSKGDALAIVAKQEGVSLANCMAFGDGMNDLEMLQTVKKGLVMQSAHDRVKKAAPELDVIGLCADEAVAHYLEDHLLK